MPSPPTSSRPGIECPRCGWGTYVAKTTNYVSWLHRVRVCQNPRCRHSFDTAEKAVQPPADRRDPDLFDRAA